MGHTQAKQKCIQTMKVMRPKHIWQYDSKVLEKQAVMMHSELNWHSGAL